MDTDRNRELTAVVTGVGLAAIASFLCLSLLTHSPYDLMDYRSGTGELSNKAGLLGAQLAHHAFCLYGSGAWVATIFLLVFGVMMCVKKSASGFTLRTLGAVLMTLMVSAWSGAMDHHNAISDSYPAGPGGLVGGTFIAPMMYSYFGQVGLFLVLVAVGFLSCLLIEQSATEAMLGLAGRLLYRGVCSFGNLIIGKRLANAGMQPAMAGAAPAPSNAGGTPAPQQVNARATAGPVLLDRGVPVPPPSKIEKPAAAKSIVEKDPTSLPEIPAPEARTIRLTPEDVKVAREKAQARENLPEELDATGAKDAVIKGLGGKISEADEEKRRMEESMRQAEEAVAKRLETDRIAAEQLDRERASLEKLEKERAEQDKVREANRLKFEAAMAEAAGANADIEGASSDEAAEEDEPLPPKKQLPVNYDLPKYELLIDKDISPNISSDTLRDRGATIVRTLWDFKIGARLAGIQSGPAVTMYEVELDPGIKVSRVVTLQDNLAMAMKAEHGVRIIAPIPGRNAIGLEIPNTEEHTVRIRPILESPQFRSKQWTLPVILGRDSVGNPLVADLATMPHLLIAGTTGSGKSVCVNSIILSLMIMRKPHEVKMLLVDPKQVEMTDFKGIPHLLSPVVTDMKLAAGVMTWAVQKMEERYERMSRVGVRNIATFNKMTTEERLARLPEGEPPENYVDPMPYIVIVVDEYADLMMTCGKEIEQAIARLAQKARAAGLHVILATQRPSADVVTGLIRTNLPCRICFQVKTKIDSRIVLETSGAEKLAGKGDMLYIGPGNSNLVRAKGVYIADAEITGVVKACKDQAEPIYSDEVERVAAQLAAGEDGVGEPIMETNRQAIELDDKFDEAVEAFLTVGRASTSLLQRRMGLGYTRAAKLCDQMEARGIVGPDRGAKGRELLISQDGWDSFKRVRANNNGSAWGPKGSKDNPGVASANPSPAPNGVADKKFGEELNEELVAQLLPIDGVKLPDEECPDDET